MAANCVITGADVWIEDAGRGLHGDLFEFEDVWVLNGVVCGREADWYYDVKLRNPLVLSIPHSSSYFERRGMLLVPKDSAVLNDEAYDYVYSSKMPT